MKQKKASPLLAPYGAMQNLVLSAKVGDGKGPPVTGRAEAQKMQPRVQRRKAT